MVKKIGVFITILGLVFVGMPQFNIKAQVIEYTNLASPDLEGKEYLGNGVYRLYNGNGVTLDYNIYNGVFTINGTTTARLNYILFNIEQNTEYILSYFAVSGTLTGTNFRFWLYSPEATLFRLDNENIDKQYTFTTTTQNQLRVDTPSGRTFNNYQFKLQLEKGDTATSYEVPIGALEQHSQFQYERGYDDGLNNRNVYFGNYYYEQGGTSDSYILRPRVKYYTTQDLTNNRVEIFNGLPYWIGSLSYLAENKTTYYGNDIPVFSLTNTGYFVFSQYDILDFYIGTEAISINPASIMTFEGNNIKFMHNGNIEYEFNSLSLSSSLTLIKDYALDPDYYIGYDIGKQEGIIIGQDIGYYDGFQEGQSLGYDLGYNLGYDEGTEVGYDIGYEYGYNNGLTETDATGL